MFFFYLINFNIKFKYIHNIRSTDGYLSIKLIHLILVFNRMPLIESSDVTNKYHKPMDTSNEIISVIEKIE